MPLNVQRREVSAQKMLRLLLTVIVAAAGGLLAARFRLPAAKMTGAMIAVCVLGLTARLSYFPADYRVFVQIISGMLIGAGVTRKDLKKAFSMGSAVVIQIVSMLAMNIVLALLFHFIGGLDLPTSFFCSAPAGVQEMALISADFGANTVYVSFVQLLRIVFIVSFMPPIYRRVVRKRAGGTTQRLEAEGRKSAGASKALSMSKAQLLSFLLTLTVSAAGGLIFRWLGVKSGAFLGAVVFSALLSVGSGKAYLPFGVKGVAQVLAGAYIGAQITRDALKVLPYVAVPVLIMAVTIVVFIVVEALVLNKYSHLDVMTCLLVSTPGGMQEMALLAQDYDCDAPVVVVMHVIRVLTIISLLPYIVNFVSQLL